MPTLREVGEHEAVRRLARARGSAGAGAARLAGVRVGSGDDAAVLRPSPGCDLVATTDAFVEGRHYDSAWLTPADVGARLAAANLSDLAAMAATPRWALLSIGARADHELDELVAMQSALQRALIDHGAGIVGGNLTGVEGPEWLSLTLFGETPAGRAWTRHGARPGDLIAATGWPGRAGAGLALARRLGAAARGSEWDPLLDAWLAPGAQVALALALAEQGVVTAAIDVSDGVGGDLARLCEASGVGADLDDAAWPDDPLLARAAHTLGVALEALRFGPSDDYELILTVEPEQRGGLESVASQRGARVTVVGRCTDAPGVVTLRDRDGGVLPLAATGFDHFSG